MESQNLFCWISVSNCAGLSLGCKDSQSGTRKYFRFKKFICFFVQKLVSKLHNKHDFTFDPSKWISYLSTKMFKKMVKSLSCAMLLYWKSFPNILRNFSRFFVWCHNVEVISAAQAHVYEHMLLRYSGKRWTGHTTFYSDSFLFSSRQRKYQ